MPAVGTCARAKSLPRGKAPHNERPDRIAARAKPEKTKAKTCAGKNGNSTQENQERAQPVHQLVGTSEADPDLGFMARMRALCLSRAKSPASIAVKSQ